MLKKSPFTKLTVFYLRKLLAMWRYLLFSVAIFFFLLIALFLTNSSEKSVFIDFDGGWRRVYGYFWLISWAQLFIMYTVMTNLIRRLADGVTPGFFKGFRKVKNHEDPLILSYCSNAARSQVYKSKLLALAGAFGVINFFLVTVPIWIFLLTTNCPVSWIIAFLPLNGLVFALANFFLLVPVIFLNKWIVTLPYAMFLLMGWQLLINFYKTQLVDKALLISSLSFPVAFAMGSGILFLAWREFSHRDLT